VVTTNSPEEVLKKLTVKKVVWLMVPAGNAVDALLFGTKTSNGILSLLRKGDVVIDGGNSFYKDSAKRARLVEQKGIAFLDVGTSGGPKGARRGACIMVGGEKAAYKKLEPLFKTLAVKNGYGYMGSAGAGHFVKMVHNGIEYGMMQSLAEGFAVMQKSSYKLDLEKIAALYDHGSVIESSLVLWLKDAYQAFGENLASVSGSVGHTGEGEWTVKTARELGVPTPIIKGAFEFRKKSEQKPSYTGQVLSALRNQFGGHDSGKKK
jgi:6-phosphogluconate dehydrogenase